MQLNYLILPQFILDSIYFIEQETYVCLKQTLYIEIVCF